MYRTVLVAWLLVLAAVVPVSAQEVAVQGDAAATAPPKEQAAADASSVVVPDPFSPKPAEGVPPEERNWETVWGVVGIRVFIEGPKTAPNGEIYHPSFSLDLDFNYWVWRAIGLYVFADMRFWAERPEYSDTNGKDGGLGFSKREFDLVGGGAWNYWGPLEARLYGYTYNNLNRGNSEIDPSGFEDGFVAENRYYFTQEYQKLGQKGYDVERADFVSIGYYVTKNLVGNDGQSFTPGLFLRASLTQDLWKLPAYVYGDFQFITESTLQAKLMLFDVGAAVRPFEHWEMFSAWQNWELRLGVENTGDFQTKSVQSLPYATIRVVF
jgi:hypothetical protein